jgi:dATP pyrophosphohydrolase
VKPKQPRSVQVVVFSDGEAGRQYLLLRRVVGEDRFWQFVTGSLEEGETHRQAAIRELREETGIEAREDELLDLGLVNVFEIAPQWLPFYRPGTTHNEEVCFAIGVNKCEVWLDPREHDLYVWVGPGLAAQMLHWESSKRALAAAQQIKSSGPSRSGSGC